MARKSSPAAKQHDDADIGALENGSKALAHVSQNATAVADMIGYDLPYNKDRVIQEARFYMGQAAETMLEAGKRLILLKEHEGWGGFLEIVREQLGLNPRAAQRMMQAATKFMVLSPKASASLVAHLTKSKLFVLMTEDESALEELGDGGTLAGIALDEMQRMTRDELIAALRDLREDSRAKDSVLAAKSKKVDSLQTQLERKKKDTPAEEWKWAPNRNALLEVCTQLSSTAQTELRRCYLAIADQAEAEGNLPEEIDLLQNQVLASVMQSLMAIQLDFHLSVDLEAIVVPPWIAEVKPAAPVTKKSK